MLAEVDQRLFRWGDYMRSIVEAELGYPRRSVIHRCMVEGPGASQATGKLSDEPMPPDIEEVESILCELSDPVIAAVRQKYLKGHLDRVGAQNCRVSVKLYRERIDRAHYYIAGRLGLSAA